MLTRRLTLIATLAVAATAALATPSVASPDDGITDAPPVDEQPAPGRRTGPPVEMRGATAAVVLKVSGTADEVASNAGLTVSELTSTLQDDPTMFVTSDGMVGYAEPAALGADPDPDALAALAAGELPADVFSLSSRPSSSKVIYLDFDGHITVGDYWNSTYGVSPIVSSPFDIDGNTSTFSTAERAAIHEVWLRVAEDYAPFDVNVTTQDPGTNGLRRTSGSDQHYGTRVVITSSDWYHAAGGGRIGGIALLSVFASSVDHAAFVFAGNLSNNAKNIAEATAHEAGHNFGLHHDGRGSSTYYGGHGQWGPLMGTGYGRAVSQWSRGEYSLATNQEDDLAKIAAYTAWVVDDHSDAFSEPTVVGYESTTGGLIGRTGDVDHFAVDAEAGKLEVTLTPTAVGSNLYAGVRVMDAGGEIIAAGTPAGPAGWSATATATVPAGRYTIEVAPLSYQTHDTGFGIYGSLGEYTLTVAARGPSTTPPPPTVPPPTTTVPATDGPPTTTPPPTTVPPAEPFRSSSPAATECRSRPPPRSSPSLRSARPTPGT